MSSIPLRGFGRGLSARLRDPIGPGRPGLRSAAFGPDAGPLAGEASAELYDVCRAALTLVAERARDEIVAREPRSSGLMLLRVSADGHGLDIAPAIDEPAWRGRPIDVHLGSDAGAPTFGTEPVTLGAIATMLPCAHLRSSAQSARSRSGSRSYTYPERLTRWSISDSADLALRRGRSTKSQGPSDDTRDVDGNGTSDIDGLGPNRI